MEYKEYYTYIFEDCGCLHEADCGCGEQEEGYPGFGYKETESDFKDPRLQKAEEISKYIHQHTLTFGQQRSIRVWVVVGEKLRKNIIYHTSDVIQWVKRTQM